MHRWRWLLLLLLVVCGCDASSESGVPKRETPSDGEAGTVARSYPYKIVTTCGMVTDIVAQVAGDKASVKGLMGTGTDPHLYKPSRRDVNLLKPADVVFYSGLMLEGRMADNFMYLARKGKPVYPITEAIDPEFLREPAEFKGHYDPHVWMDVSAWSECVAFIAKALGEFDPANADYYFTNADAYRKRLVKVDDYVRRTIATIPQESRVLVTAHDAFGYFARAYDIQVRSVQGLSTESEASVQDVNKLVQFIVDRKIPAIFVESSVPRKNVEAIIEGAAQQDVKVSIGGVLFSDAMGKPSTYEGTYIGMIDHNVTVITRALGGEAPASGLNGKLTLLEH